MPLVKICPRCGKIIDRELKYCKECTSRINKDYNRYKRDMETQKIYNSKEWEISKSKAEDRDMGLCISCYHNKTIKYSQLVHHIIELKDDLSKAFDLNNLICLCESCHQKIHKVYKTKNKVKMQNLLRNLIKHTRGGY